MVENKVAPFNLCEHVYLVPKENEHDVAYTLSAFWYELNTISDLTDSL